MDCSKCSKKMIKTGTGICLTSYPPVYPQIWWCGCGYTEDAEPIIGETIDDSRRKEWERTNNFK